MTTPTLDKMVKVYVVSAEVERLKCGRPSKNTVANTLLGVKTFRRWLNERRIRSGHNPFTFQVSDKSDDNDTILDHGAEATSSDAPLVSIIKPPLIHRYLSEMLKQGVKPITAMTYIEQFQQLFAKWVRPYYDDRGWKIPEFPKIGGRPKAPRYCRPSSEQLAKVKTWYLNLQERVQNEETNTALGTQQSALKHLWFAATMMLEFAMRNSDILLLNRTNFIEYEGRVYLNYTPHKTMHSSGRVVKWPVHRTIWEQIKDYTFGYDESTFVELNKIMRGLGFTGNKGAYELRKICIDHIYQQFGAEKAVSVSGDNIRTIMYYYADPSQPNIGELRVTDLL